MHVDAKVDEIPFKQAVAASQDAETVEFVTPRELVNWSGYSQVRAIRRLIARGLQLVESRTPDMETR